jgi:hypothetical protein
MGVLPLKEIFYILYEPLQSKELEFTNILDAS